MQKLRHSHVAHCAFIASAIMHQYVCVLLLSLLLASPSESTPSSFLSRGTRRRKRTLGTHALSPQDHADRNGRQVHRNGVEIDHEVEAAVFDGRKSPFGSAAQGKRRAMLSPPSSAASAELTSSSPSPPQDDNTAFLLRRRDRALLALQQHLGLNTTASLGLLTRFPELYGEDCPSLGAKLLYLLNEVNLPKKRLCHMLFVKPTLLVRILTDSGYNLVGTVEVLQTELGMTSSDLLGISSGRLPAVLGYDRSELRRRIKVYKHELGYPEDVLRRMVLTDPEMLRTDASKVQGSILVLREELGMDAKDVHRLLHRAPLIMSYNPEGNIRPTVQFLKQGLIGRCLGLVKRKGVSAETVAGEYEREALIRERVREFVLKFPNILALSVDKNVRPTLNFFLEAVGLSELQLGKVLTRRPPLLELKVGLMRTKLDFLREQTGATDVELAEIVVRFPEVFSLSVANSLKPKIEYLYGEMTGVGGQFSGLGMNATQVRHVLHKKPQILSLNLERNILPKVAYLVTPVANGGAGLTLGEVRDWFASYPQTVM